MFRFGFYTRLSTSEVQIAPFLAEFAWIIKKKYYKVAAGFRTKDDKYYLNGPIQTFAALLKNIANEKLQQPTKKNNNIMFTSIF